MGQQAYSKLGLKARALRMGVFTQLPQEGRVEDKTGICNGWTRMGWKSCCRVHRACCISKHNVTGVTYIFWWDWGQ